jgi:hypothetical protein
MHETGTKESTARIKNSLSNVLLETHDLICDAFLLPKYYVCYRLWERARRMLLSGEM